MLGPEHPQLRDPAEGKQQTACLEHLPHAKTGAWQFWKLLLDSQGKVRVVASPQQLCWQWEGQHLLHFWITGASEQGELQSWLLQHFG